MKSNKTFWLNLLLYTIQFALDYMIVSGVISAVSYVATTLVLVVANSVGALSMYIAVRLVVSNGTYEFHPVRKMKLEKANKLWQKSIERIRITGDYGMCCNEEMAIKCSKEYYFGELLKYADEYEAAE